MASYDSNEHVIKCIEILNSRNNSNMTEFASDNQIHVKSEDLTVCRQNIFIICHDTMLAENLVYSSIHHYLSLIYELGKIRSALGHVQHVPGYPAMFL